MQLTIIGAGAIGGTIGAHMIRAGHDILFCDTDADHVDAINRHGLTIEGPIENFTVPARAVLPAELPARIEHAAIAVKSHFTAAAAEPLRTRLSPTGYVVSLQNGMTADTIAAVVGRERLLVSFINVGADYLGPGHIVQGNVAAFHVGELGEPGSGSRVPISDRVRELVDALPYAQATDNIEGFIWGKEAYGAMLFAGAVSDLSIAETFEDPRWRPLLLALAREVLAQSPAEPEGFDGFDPNDLEGSLGRLAVFNRASAKTHSGIYRDLMVRKRKTEVDAQIGELAGPLTTRIVELIHSIEDGERTCEVANLELLAAYERADRDGRRLHALVDILPRPRRAAAGPLLGVPVAVKDIVDVEGSVRGNGNPLSTVVAASDAPVVAGLRQLAADVFARTALLEYAAGATHPDIPETMNPFDPARTAGGSSGGSAAFVGSGVCDLAIGTDTGGSIRIPAHYCGIVGFKPTFGALSTDGVTPLAPSLDHVGLLGSSVGIVARAFDGLRGSGAKSAARSAESVRIGVLRELTDHHSVEGGVAAAIEVGVRRLSRSGIELIDVVGFPLDELLAVFEPILGWELWRVHGHRAESEPTHFGAETLRLILSARDVTEEEYRAALVERERLQERTAALYEGVDALLLPAAPFVAPATTPPIDTPEGSLEGMFTAPFNLTGAPAIALPCGWSGHLPVGLQLTAPIAHDRQLLAVAKVVESSLAFSPRR